ncbi:MAG TPA: MASE1 domain-containing protein [Thermoanaerobaculia bacterium]|nr:MASE1 domain-containing protein [Thermoanaerobaculia bacterium]
MPPERQSAAPAQEARLSPLNSPVLQSAVAALAVSALYLAGMKIGSALTAAGTPISTLWPPNALLMAALLVAPRRLWPLFLAVLLPVHVLFQTHLGLPLGASLGWFLGNTGEALIGAALLRATSRGEPMLGTTRGVVRFVLLGALLAPIVTSFWDAAVVLATGLGSGYWNLFATRLLSNVIAILLFVPPVVLAFDGSLRRMRRASPRRWLEAAALGTAAVLCCLFLDLGPIAPHVFVLEIYAQLPLFVWAALRFGPFESSLAVLTVTLLEVWLSVHGHGLFAAGSAAQNALSLQTYSALIAIPLLFFAVTVEERRRADKELRRNQEALAEAEKIGSLARSAARMVNWTLDVPSGAIFAEPALPSLLGFEFDPNRTSIDFWLSRISEPDRPQIKAFMDTILRPQALSAGQDDGPVHELEYRVHHADGSLRWFHTRLTVERGPDRSPRRVIGTAMDVTQRKTAELEAQEQRRELTHLARVSALGELSGALAHELNQPLASILSNAQAARLLIGRESPDLAEIGKILDDIAAEDRRAGDTIRHLRKLLRRGAPHLQTVNLNTSVAEILSLMRGDLITRNVAVRTSLAPGLPPVQADPIEVQQVLLNLILNACDAMGENRSDDRVLTLITCEYSSSVVVSVSDVGPGIPGDCMGSLFRPFFTTKADGLGMGLAICQSIAAGIGGRLWAENNPDRGSTFRLAVPLAEDRASRG